MTSMTTEPRSGIDFIHPTPSNNKSARSSQDLLIMNYDTLKLVFSLFIAPLADSEGDLPGPGLPLPSEGRQQLYAISKVCKDFHEPALDCLWHNLPGIEPLLKLHPALTVINGAYCPQQIDADKVGKFKKFSKRVRGIRLGPTEPSVHTAFASYAWLGQQQNTLPLVPALRRIYLGGAGGDAQQLGLLPLILSPSINAVEFQGPLIFIEAFRSWILPLVCTSADAMQSFSMTDPSHCQQVPIWDGFTRIAGSLPINTLEIRFPNNPTMPPSFVGQLGGKFAHLTSLTLDVHTPSHSASHQISSKAFPALSSLRLVNRSHTKICGCYPPQLVQQATSITLYVESSVTNVGAFKDALDTLSAIQPLARVRIEQSYPHHEISILASAVCPFLQRLNLEELHLGVWGLDSGPNNPHGQQAIKVLADAGSGLRSLTLPLGRRAVYWSPPRRVVQLPRPNYPSVGSLVYFAQQAPALRHLALSIDSSAAEENGVTSSFKTFAAGWNPERISNLRHLELADVRAASAPVLTGAQCKDLALLLDAIFPNLEFISMLETTEEDTARDEQWDTIDELRRSFKELRLYRSGHF